MICFMGVVEAETYQFMLKRGTVDEIFIIKIILNSIYLWRKSGFAYKDGQYFSMSISFWYFKYIWIACNGQNKNKVHRLISFFF